ncbi:triosephosphate isomerase [Hasllibacter halocynthiae]|uniref:Triosephosphate isomerase n=1 Tax=Hasllibacter halocynthiae TaxID=595589 RepID=A0A2T0X7J8_9RHOB|nr:triose-phosphate isomerase [Hasllibacter halocynthiae]PRY94920.1 triosephosphate isomerase [Hasllibacter halocynthiae]
MRKLAAGNWKMNGTSADLAAVRAVAEAAPGGIDVLLALPATLLDRARDAGVALAGQDCHAAAKGAHTGDLAAAMLADAGATAVILGHSERRADHGETDDAIRAKAEAAVAAGLAPVICVGETLDQREGGRALDVVGAQLAGSVPDRAPGLVVAYEPVWAIGTGRVPTPDQIAEVHAFLAGRVPAGTRLLYGGSVKGSNAAEIFAVPHVHGALVGGASLKPGDFAPIMQALAAS